MHETSYRHMQDLVTRHLSKTEGKRLRILDIGSCDVNGSYRPLFQRPNWEYLGVDMAPGPNVDIVLPDPYRWACIGTRSADIVISGQAFEHIEFFWLTWLQMVRVVRPSGLIFLIAPSRGPEHRYPVDCWRFYPDAYRALAKYGGLELLEVTTDLQHDSESSMWGDTVGVFRKVHLPKIKELREILTCKLLSPLGIGRVTNAEMDASITCHSLDHS